MYDIRVTIYANINEMHDSIVKVNNECLIFCFVFLFLNNMTCRADDEHFSICDDGAVD